MNYSDNAINILTVKTYKGIGRAWIVKNLKGNEPINKIISLIDKDTKENYPITAEDFERRKERVINDVSKLKSCADGIVALGDADFPPYRGNVKSSEQPIAIFYRGNLSLLKANNQNIAVIGLLDPDYNTEIIEREVVAELVKRGATIVSGLALGCDTIAHKQTLSSNGKTIAILPSQLNNILPATNIKLANQIVENNGLLITEYYYDVKSKTELSSRYQERDRLQALFSDGIILTASYAKNNIGNDSGSRLAMGYALSYSIPRAIIYDSTTDFDNPKYDLNKQLMSEQKEITVINRENLVSSINKIIISKPQSRKEQIHQLSVFDLMESFSDSPD